MNPMYNQQQQMQQQMNMQQRQQQMNMAQYQQQQSMMMNQQQMNMYNYQQQQQQRNQYSNGYANGSPGMSGHPGMMMNNNMRNRPMMNMNTTMNNNNGRNNNNNSNNHNGGNSGNGGSNNSNNANNNNKGPTKDTWISPFKNREQNINFFMFAYKCQPCSLRRNCPSKVTCPAWHHEGEKRRNPGEDPNFLYSEEPCPNVKPQGSNKWQPPSRCSDGDECGYSHTLLEQMYHPNIYKTSMCINFTNPQGNKCQWGFYCTHAHGQDDIRNPNKNKSSSNPGCSGPNSPSNPSTSKTNNEQKDKPSVGTKTDNINNVSSTNDTNKQSLFPIKQQLLTGDKMKKSDRQRAMSDQTHLPKPMFNQNVWNQQHQQHQQSSHSHNSSGPMHSLSPQMPVYGGRTQHTMPSRLSPMQQQYSADGVNAMNGNMMHPATNHPTPPRQNSAPSNPTGTTTSSKYDYSPLPAQRDTLIKQQQNPPNFTLQHPHDPNTMYQQHSSYNNYYLNSWREQKRGRSASDGTLPSYVPQKASQAPSFNKYPSATYHPQQTQATNNPYYNPIPRDDPIPTTTPYLNDQSRESATFNTLTDATTNDAKYKVQRETAANGTGHNNSTPPPMTADKAKSYLQPPQLRYRSTSHGDLLPTFVDSSNPYLPPTRLERLEQLKQSASLPSSQHNKIDGYNPTDERQYLFVKTPDNLGNKKRRRSGSEPLLPPLPTSYRYYNVTDSIWKTGPNQDPNKSSSNSPTDDKAKSHSASTTPSYGGSNKGAFSDRATRLKAIPSGRPVFAGGNSSESLKIINPEEQAKDDFALSSPGVFSPGAYDIWAGAMSPVDNNNNTQFKIPIELPKTPPCPPKQVTSSDDIAQLRKQLDAATKEIKRLKIEKQAEILELDDRPSFGSSVKKSINMDKQSKTTNKANDDEKLPTDEDDDDNKVGHIDDNEENLKNQQLARYQHFITCPSCKSRENVRNQVLVPCGHLICNKCSNQTESNHNQCPLSLCNQMIERKQTLLIG